MNTQQNSPDVVINATNRVPQDIKASSLLTVAQLNNEETDPAAMSLEVSLVTSNELQQKQQAEKEEGKGDEDEEQAEEEVLNKIKNKTSVFDIPNVSSLSLKKKKRHKISKRSVTATSIQDKNLIINVQDVDIKQDEVNGIAAINSDNVSLIKTIKTSLSLSSLPPDEYQEECRDVIKAKLNLERPYNSLKKNADRNLTNQLAQRHARTYERLDGGVGVSTGTGTGDNCCYGDKDNNNYASNSKLQRCSWYSGHSSSSLHSSAATLGIGSGKDDLWAAIQTNYNYIMDTNLLDTCKEARCEIERATSVLDNQMDKCFKVSWGNGLDACCSFQNVFIALLTPSSAKHLLDDNQRNEGFCSDPKELRKWLREMEHKIHKAPTLTQATQLSCMELEKHLAEHSILYHEIVSHARVVSACIRAATNKELPLNSRCQQQQQQQLIQNPEQQTSLNSTDSSLIAEQTNSSLSSTDETISTATNGGNNNNNSNNKNNSNNNTTTTTTTLSSSSGIGGTITFDLQKATSSDTASTTSTNTSTSVATPAQQHKKSDNNLERLQNRYHLLYLKAFEVQLWLDGLLRKKTKSPGNTSIEDDLDSEENIDDLTDYECELNEDVDGHREEKQQYIEAGATEDDFNDVISDLETDITHEQATDLLYQDVKRYNHCQQQSLHLVDEDNNLQISTNNRILQHLQIQPQQQQKQQNCNCKHSKIDYEDGDDEEDEDDDVDDSDNKDVIDGIQWIYNGSRVLKGRSISKQNQPKSSIITTFTPTLTDFEADSESSDLETVKSHMRNYRKHHQVFAHNFIPMKRNNHQQGTNTKKPINCNMNSVWSAVKTLMVNELQQEEHLSQRDIVEVVTSETASTEAATSAKAMPCSGSTTVQNIAEIPVKAIVNESNYKQPQKRLEPQPDEKNIAIMSPNNQHHIRANKVSTMLRSQTQQQQKHKQKQQQRKKSIHPSTDISKFNRSNRKSKNCAIFYFRHLDTDNETNCSTTTTSTTNRVEEDIADHDNDDEANYEFDYEYDEVADDDDDDDDDDENDDDDGGCDVIENCIHAAKEDSEIYVEGNGVLSSSCCNSHTSDQLKSADASSDDGGWLYSRAPAHVQTKTKVKTITQVAATVGDCLNSNKTRLSIDDNNCCDGSFSLPVNTAESSLTSSTSSSLGSNLGNSTQLPGAVVAIPEAVLTSSICDSDKNSLYIDGDISIHANYNNMTVFNDCSNSSSSSNDMLTEATTATSNSSTHTNVTQILNIDPIQRNGVELQLNNNSIVNNFQYNNNNNNNNNNDNHYKLSSYNAMAQFVAVIDHHNDSNNNNNNDNNNNSNNHDSNNNNRNRCANSSRSIVSAVSGVATAANNLQTTLLTETNQRTLSTSSQSLPAMTTAVIAPSLLHDVNGGDITNNANIIGKANARSPIGGHVVTGKLSSNPSHHHQRHHHQHHPDYNGYSNQPCISNNRQQHYQKIMHGQALLHVNVGKSLPPRSPAKVHTSNLLTNSNSYTTSPLSPGQVQENHKVSHECIKQLVLEAEHLVRDEALKTPTKQQQQQQQLQHKHSNNTPNNNTLVQISTTIKKRENVMVGPIKQRVQEWLEHQPTSTPIQQQRNCHDLMVSVNNGNASHTPNADDCEASGEASETDSIPQQCSDTSEGFTDSIATCLQTSTNSQGNSTERIGGSAEPIAVHSNQSLNMNMKVIKRQQTRRKSERPWSVSCLSQLTTTTTDSGGQMLRTKKITNSQVQAGLASHSISESALDSLSPRRPRDCTNATIQSHHHHSHHHNHHHHHQHQVKSYDSKNSLKRRKTRKKRLSYSGGKKSDTGSEDYCALNGSAKLSQNLLIQTAETMTNQQLKDITQALLSLQKAASCSTHHLSAQVTNGNNGTANQINALVGNASNANNNNINESEEEPTNLMQPNFRVGSFTTAYMTSEARLGPLAALATYMNDEGQQQGAYTTGPEDQHSSFSETAWDNYQEKYNSENYSEGFDSDAARRLMEFGDDYRNFIDSQSDCCSSLSAANNLESLSPPRMDSLPQQSNETKLITHDAIVSSVDHARRRRALELEYERRRKNLELRRKSCQESSDHHQTTKSAFVISPPTTSHLMVVTAKNTERLSYHHAKVGAETLPRKLEFGMSHSSSQSLRRTSESDTSQRRRKPHDDRRRSSRNLDKCIKVIPATSSSSGDDSDNEKEIRNLLQQSRNRLEDTRALKIRCHLLRPEDYNEIVNTCRDNIRCLESVIRGPSSSVLTTYCINQSKDLLSAWEDLLAWSENAAAARKMQEEMIVLKYALNRLGNKSSFELLDTEPAIQIAIEALKNEKVQLQTYRTSMLKLNASVHSWLTRQEKRLESAVMEQKVKEAATVANSIISGGNNSCTSSSGSNSDGSNMMCADGEKLIEMKEEIVQVQRQQQQQEQHDQQQQQQVNLLKLNNNDNNNLVENNNGQVTTSTTNTITIIDSNGNQIETHTVAGTNLSNAMSLKQTMSTSTTTTTTTTTATATTTTTSDEEKELDLNTLINSENEFHKHLKNEVSDMYTAWDEADARINSQLEILTSSLIAWRQLESGLCEFQLALGQDRGTLQGLEGALERGQASPGELVQNVKLVAKLLSEKINVSHEQLTAAHDYLDPNHILQIARFTASNGSLSDSGISDGGTTSDGGLSERERRLGMLRRLAKQLESALAPGSDAMKSIAARMESAEAELKSLQNTCRDLIVRTAASQQNKKLLLKELTEYADNEKSRQKSSITVNKGNGHMINNQRNRQEQQGQEQQQNNSLEMFKNKRNRRLRRNVATQNITPSSDGVRNNAQTIISQAPDDYDDDPSDDPTAKYELDSSDDEQTGKPRRGWAWRIARVAVPMQLALFTVFCAACLMQPNCCDNINNFSMSFTPQLRYVRGPPPI